MNSQNTVDGRGRTNILIATVTLGVSIFVAYLLLRTAVSATRMLEGLEHGSIPISVESPQLGPVSGWDAISDSEWHARPDTVVVFFAVSEDEGIGGVEYWREVSRRGQRTGSMVQYVGFCASAKICEVSTPDVSEDNVSFALLKAADPVLIQTLSAASAQQVALVYSSRLRLLGKTSMQKDPEDTALEISKIIPNAKANQPDAMNGRIVDGRLAEDAQPFN